MIYICAQPAILYYAWQIDTMLYNFKDIGIDLNNVHIVCSFKTPIDPYFRKLEKKYSAKFFYYQDTRFEPDYISSIRPHILAKHFENNKYLENTPIFYHDCDIVFARPLELKNYISNNINYLSDTISYIGHDYIKSKGEEVLNLMCSVMNICSCKVRANQHNSGGAQYLLKNIPADFWKTVENDSENLFYALTEYNKVKKQDNPEYHELQIWCADMWALLWNLWKIGRPTAIIPEMDFVWPTEKRDSIQNKSIIHNAGVINNKDRLFYKSDYRSKLPDLNLDIDETRASSFYYSFVKKALLM